MPRTLQDSPDRNAGAARLVQMAEALAGIGHWRFDFRTRKVEWSEQVYRIHGVTPESFDPNIDAAVEAYHPDDRPQIAAMVERAAESGEPYAATLRLRRLSDGSERIVSLRAAAETDPRDGQPIAVFGVFQDVTEQQAALDRAETSERRYRLIADNATDMILRLAADGTILYSSPACRQLGFEPHEVVGHNLLDGVHREERESTRATLAALFAGEPVETAGGRRHRVRTKDGRWVWLEGAPSAVRDESGRVVEVINVLRDVTDHVLMESELRHAKAQADAAAAAKADFLATMSHEIRTPLTSVIGFSRLLNEMEGLTDSARHFAGRISRASQSLLALINDILDYSKLEAGQVAIHRQPTQTRTFLSDIQDMFASQTAARGLALTLSVDGAVPDEINIDPDRLRQVLVNLIGNAVKFTDTGQVEIVAHWEPQSEVVILSVRDTGVGIPSDRLTDLFKRFSQVDGSSTRKHGGTGLGLAICKGLVEAMGGKIGVDSVEGEGSRFWFVLPAGAGVAETPAPPEIQFAPHARILVVDDHEPNRALVRGLLAPYPVAVDEAVDGEMAAAMAARTPYAAIIMDMHMPAMDGQTAAKAIKTGGESQATPILAFSGDRRVQATAGSGFDGLLDKPISASALLAALCDALAARPA